ncbi:MAG: hypothetical protein J7J91_06910 [Deltaproteobacteria bacterium]|nr:hypothetical protein [Deltaproteobacteria bacterium]
MVSKDMIDAERAIEIAMEVAKKANLPMLFTNVSDAKLVDSVWKVVIEWVGTNKKYLAEIDTHTGKCRF